MAKSRSILTLGVGLGLGSLIWGLTSPGIAHLDQPSITGVVPPSLTPDPQPDPQPETPDRLSFATLDGLFSVAVDGRDRQSFPLADAAPTSYQDLAWSPGGDWLAVVRNYRQVAIYSSASNRWYPSFASDCDRSPDLRLTWAVDSPRLLLRELCQVPTLGLPSRLNLYVRDGVSDGDTPWQPLPLPPDLRSDLYLSPDASQVAFVSGDHIYTLATTLEATPQPLTTVPGVYSAGGSPLAWSPDGRQIAFYEGTYPYQRIYVMQADGSDRRLLTPDPDHQIYRSRLLWSPDGEYLAYYRPFDPPYSNQETVQLIQVETGDIRQIARPGFYHALSWSPDGQQLVVSSGNYFAPQALFLYDLAQNQFTQITTDPLTQILVVQWSTAGDWLAFTAQRGSDELANQQLYVVRPNGDDLRVVTGAEEYVYPVIGLP